MLALAPPCVLCCEPFWLLLLVPSVVPLRVHALVAPTSASARRTHRALAFAFIDAIVAHSQAAIARSATSRRSSSLIAPLALGVVRRRTAELLPQRAKRGELDRDSVDLAVHCHNECIVNSKAQIAARRCLHVRSSQRRDPLRPASDEASRSDRPAVSQAMLRRLAYPLQPALASAAPRNLEDRPDERS